MYVHGKDLFGDDGMKASAGFLVRGVGVGGGERIRRRWIPSVAAALEVANACRESRWNRISSVVTAEN